jgi:hypothetical protein
MRLVSETNAATVAPRRLRKAKFISKTHLIAIQLRWVLSAHSSRRCESSRWCLARRRRTRKTKVSYSLGRSAFTLRRLFRTTNVRMRHRRFFVIPFSPRVDSALNLIDAA